jgi:hypothetical protein
MSAWFGIILLLSQAVAAPGYIAEGDRVEQEFRAYRERLNEFFNTLQKLVTQEAPRLLTELRDRPPRPAVYGYQILPTMVEDPPAPAQPVASFSYSWPTTREYVQGETVKLTLAEISLRELETRTPEERPEVIAALVREYRRLVQNQRTVDQYLQYNRFWQREIARDRGRFDRLTKVYELIKGGQPDHAAAIREALGEPDAPSFINVRRVGKDRVVLRVPLYTDIEDAAFLERAEAIIERMWQAKDSVIAYSVDVDLRQIKNLGPSTGDRIDLNAHAGRFPKNGAILTTGAPSTHSIPGRYIALGPGDLSGRTLAHEFGHILGFRDGYIRGYRDLGERGFEILELTPSFDDIMSAPRQGNVQATHFKLLLDALK